MSKVEAGLRAHEIDMLFISETALWRILDDARRELPANDKYSWPRRSCIPDRSEIAKMSATRRTT